MTFNEVLTILRDSDTDEKISFTHPNMVGYFVKEELGELIYYDQHGVKEIDANFFLSDFDRDDWEILK